MARYKCIDTGPRLPAVDLARQQLPGTFEYALNHLIDHDPDATGFDGRYRHDRSGAPALPPAMLLKVVLLAYRAMAAPEAEATEPATARASITVLPMAERSFGSTV